MDLLGPEDTPPIRPALPQNAHLPRDEIIEAVERPRDASSQGLALPEDMIKYPRIFLQGINPRKAPSLCKLCTRILNSITQHHVHPKVNGERRAPTGVEVRGLNLAETIPLCRPCHTIIHMVIPNEAMSDSYSTLEQLNSHPRVQTWVTWVRRQRIPSSQSLGQPVPPRVLRPSKSKKIKSKTQESKPDIDSVAQIQNALAKIWHDSGSKIPRSLGDQTVLQREISTLVGCGLIRIKKIRKVMAREHKYQEWYKWAFLAATPTAPELGGGRRENVAPEWQKVEKKEDMTVSIKKAVERIWSDAGYDFPRFPGNHKARRNALQDEVEQCIGSSKCKHADIQRIMQLNAKYRAWFEWTYPGMTWCEGGQAVTRSGRVYRPMPAGDIREEEDDVDSDSEIDFHDVTTPGRLGLDNPSGSVDGEDDDGVATRHVGTGSGSRADPIVFDLTDHEGGMASPDGREVVHVSSCGRVTIDLTME